MSSSGTVLSLNLGHLQVQTLRSIAEFSTTWARRVSRSSNIVNLYVDQPYKGESDTLPVGFTAIYWQQMNVEAQDYWVQFQVLMESMRFSVVRLCYEAKGSVAVCSYQSHFHLWASSLTLWHSLPTPFLTTLRLRQVASALSSQPAWQQGEHWEHKRGSLPAFSSGANHLVARSNQEELLWEKSGSAPTSLAFSMLGTDRRYSKVYILIICGILVGTAKGTSLTLRPPLCQILSSCSKASQ